MYCSLKKILCCAMLSLVGINAAQAETYDNDTTVHQLDEVSVVSFYRSNLRTGTTLSRQNITIENRGQEPSFIMARMPSVMAYSDTGNEYGYSYIRMRGIDQTPVKGT